MIITINTFPKPIIESLKRFLQQNNIPIKFKCENETKQEIYSFSGGANEIEVTGPYQYFESMMNGILQRKKNIKEEKKSYSSIYETLFGKKKENSPHRDTPLQQHTEDLQSIEPTEPEPTEPEPTEPELIKKPLTEDIKKISTVNIIWNTDNDKGNEKEEQEIVVDEDVLKGTKIYYMYKRDGMKTRFI